MKKDYPLKSLVRWFGRQHLQSHKPYYDDDHIMDVNIIIYSYSSYSLLMLHSCCKVRTVDGNSIE